MSKKQISKCLQLLFIFGWNVKYAMAADKDVGDRAYVYPVPALSISNLTNKCEEGGLSASSSASGGRSRSASVRESKLASTEAQSLPAKSSETEKDALILRFGATIQQIGCQNNFSNLDAGHLYLIGERGKRVRIPADFWDALLSLTWLKSITITNYELSLPESICALKELTSIRLKNNLLKSLPQSISSLPKLRWINVENNQLQSLPKNIQGLKGNNLQLDLKGNPLRERGEKGITLGIVGLKKVFGNRVSIDPLQSTPQAKEDKDFIPVTAASSSAERAKQVIPQQQSVLSRWSLNRMHAEPSRQLDLISLVPHASSDLEEFSLSYDRND